MGPGEYELAKMAVAPAERRHGIGRRLMTAAIALAEHMGATRLYLESNATLPAPSPFTNPWASATCRYVSAIPARRTWSAWSDNDARTSSWIRRPLRRTVSV